MQLLNIGCGRRFHPDWTNIDLVAAAPEVREYDLRTGLPYGDETFDAVYHSHVLEHLTPAAAEKMLRECARVLKPNGILRIAVPDLEGIAREYLRTLEAVARDPANASMRFAHRWMTLELLDQMCRQKSGGSMGAAIRASEGENHRYIRSRIGQEVDGNGAQGKKTIWRRVKRLSRSLRKQFALAAVTLIDGEMGRAAYLEGRFRQGGEIHRWMYDRVSLASLLRETGFESAMVCSATQSSIPNFASYLLDADTERTRKPDSLFLESNKLVVQEQVPTATSRLRNAA